MHSSVRVVYDSERGCGYRHKKGAMYFVTDSAGVPCGALPLELKPCPTCASMGLKCRVSPTRGWTWINPSLVFDWKSVRCERHPLMNDARYPDLCGDCPMSVISRLERCGLLWCGEKYYPTPDDFDAEAKRLGISRRLPHDHVPVGFKVGRDYIMLAHKKAVLRLGHPGESSLVDYYPGVFRVFKPQEIQVLCDGTETDEEIESYLERGLTPVKVERA